MIFDEDYSSMLFIIVISDRLGIMKMILQEIDEENENG